MALADSMRCSCSTTNGDNEAWGHPFAHVPLVGMRPAAREPTRAIIPVKIHWRYSLPSGLGHVRVWTVLRLFINKFLINNILTLCKNKKTKFQSQYFTPLPFSYLIIFIVRVLNFSFHFTPIVTFFSEKSIFHLKIISKCIFLSKNNFLLKLFTNYRVRNKQTKRENVSEVLPLKNLELFSVENWLTSTTPVKLWSILGENEL